MKKLTAVVCIVMLLTLIMATAFAASSIGKPKVVVVGGDDKGSDTESSWWYEVREVNPEVYAIDALKDIVNAVNEEMAVEEETEAEEEDAMTVREAVEAMQAYLPAGTMLDEEGVVTIKANTEDDENTVIDLNKYDFVTEFKDLVYTNGTEALYGDQDGKGLSPELTIQVDALKGADELSGYLLMVVHPETGETSFVDMAKTTNFNSASGTIEVKFPTLGTFSLIQK